jgi:hypothetical protein
LEPFHGKQEWPNDPSKEKIISIQFQPLDWITGKPLGSLSILKEWEVDSSEKIIIEQFKNIFRFDNKWAFIPVGNNLPYDFIRLEYKFAQYCGLCGLKLLLDKPSLDIKPILIVHNKGCFKDSTAAIGKKGISRKIPEWYDKKDFNAIEQYIRDEAQSFVTAYHRMKMVIPEIRLN